MLTGVTNHTVGGEHVGGAGEQRRHHLCPGELLRIRVSHTANDGLHDLGQGR